MRTSQDTAKLVQALVKAQEKFPDIPKDKEVNAGSRRYRYAELATILSAVRKPLAESGLSVTAAPDVDAQGALWLVSRLSHVSGEWMEACYPLPKADQGSQIMGSAITYGRRYTICSLLNVCADDDDDGEAASQPRPANGSGSHRPATPPPPPAQKPPQPQAMTGGTFKLGGVETVGNGVWKLTTGSPKIVEILTTKPEFADVARTAAEKLTDVSVTWKVNPKGNNVLLTIEPALKKEESK